MINFPGPDKLILLAMIALVVLGPTRLPAAARTAGRLVGELRKLSARFQEEVRGTFGDTTDPLTSAVGDLRNQVGSLRNDLTGFARPFGNTGGNDMNGSTSPSSASSAGSPATPSEVVEPSGWPAHSVPPAAAPLPPVPDDPSLN